jgi:hypothetical protein
MPLSYGSDFVIGEESHSIKHAIHTETWSTLPQWCQRSGADQRRIPQRWHGPEKGRADEFSFADHESAACATVDDCGNLSVEQHAIESSEFAEIFDAHASPVLDEAALFIEVISDSEKGAVKKVSFDSAVCHIDCDNEMDRGERCVFARPIARRRTRSCRSLTRRCATRPRREVLGHSPIARLERQRGSLEQSDTGFTRMRSPATVMRLPIRKPLPVTTGRDRQFADEETEEKQCEGISCICLAVDRNDQRKRIPCGNAVTVAPSQSNRPPFVSTTQTVPASQVR